MKDKDKIGIDTRRKVYMNHSFEVKINEKMESLYITFDNYDRFCRATTKAENNRIETFRYNEGGKEWFIETKYAKFCIDTYHNVPDDYDEAILEYEIKKKEHIEREIKKEAMRGDQLVYGKGGWQSTKDYYESERKRLIEKKKVEENLKNFNKK